MANAELVARMTEGASTKETDEETKRGWVVMDDSKTSPKLEDQLQEGRELMDDFAKKIEGDDDDLPF